MTAPLTDQPTGFDLFGFHSSIVRGLDAAGFRDPRPIQAETIPAALEGRDVLGLAQTGTGKTAAYSIPLLEAVDKDAKDPQALVLVPTRELAVQVKVELSRLGQYTGVKILAVYGGQAMNLQLELLQRGVQIIVATPGRLMDHMQRGTLDIGRVKAVVLDEADQMLDIGFAAVSYTHLTLPTKG